MNPAAIARHVADMVPDAKYVAARDCGRGVWAIVCMIDAHSRCVQFDAAGLYGSGGSSDTSDILIAAAIAKELRR